MCCYFCCINDITGQFLHQLKGLLVSSKVLLNRSYFVFVLVIIIMEMSMRCTGLSNNKAHKIKTKIHT